MNWRKNIILKKGFRYISHFKRAFSTKSVKGYPAILYNSFPKSGTYLLMQILVVVPELKDMGFFITSTPSLSMTAQESRKIGRKISLICEKELVGGHIYYFEEIKNYILKNNIIHFFIYRDPRDVVISEAHYLYNMNKYHRLHRYFKRYPDINDRIMFSIKGNTFHKTLVNYGTIRERFENYEGWLTAPGVCTVRYEDLVGSNRRGHIYRLFNHYLKNSNSSDSIDELVSKAIQNINPQKSHTFREGGTQKWKAYFTPEHKKAFKEIAGDLLIELGYETDYDW